MCVVTPSLFVDIDVIGMMNIGVQLCAVQIRFSGSAIWECP
jgi:hypothetical protein